MIEVFALTLLATIAAQLAPGPKRVVVLGPSHRHAFRGVALPDADAMATPCGSVPIDREGVDALLGEPDVAVVPEAFAQEHSIEVELPFLQRRLGDFALLPLVVGDISPDRMVALLENVWGGPETLIVISTDLSHFLTAAEASNLDGQTATAVEMAAAGTLGAREACGHRPLAAFLTCARARGMRLTRAGLTHSGTVTGDDNRVVGYGAWVAHLPADAALSPQHRAAALRLARQALVSRARRGKDPAIKLESFPQPLQGHGAAFVSLSKDGRLRGCIGSLRAHRPLAKDILDNAIRAGFHDPRFQPVTEAELTDCLIEISLLSQAAPMTFDSEDDLLRQLVPGRDGLILQSQGQRGTFLPKVWDSLPTTEAFVNGLKVKAGLPRDHWNGDVKIWRYMAEDFAESRAGPE